MIGRILRVNSIHLQESTIETLHEEAVCEEAQYPMGKKYKLLSVFHRGMDGFFIDINFAEYKQLTHDKSIYPNDLRVLIEFATNNECSLICIAEGEDVVKGLLKYE